MLPLAVLRIRGVISRAARLRRGSCPLAKRTQCRSDRRSHGFSIPWLAGPSFLQSILAAGPIALRIFRRYHWCSAYARVRLLGIDLADVGGCVGSPHPAYLCVLLCWFQLLSFSCCLSDAVISALLRPCCPVPDTFPNVELRCKTGNLPSGALHDLQVIADGFSVMTCKNCGKA